MTWINRPPGEYELSINSGNSESGSLNLGGLVPVALVIYGIASPVEMSFLVHTSPNLTDAADYVALRRDDGSEYVITPSPASYTALVPVLFAGVNKMRVRAGTSTGPLVLGTTLSFFVILRQP
jgi:hypothetical protein